MPAKFVTALPAYVRTFLFTGIAVIGAFFAFSNTPSNNSTKDGSANCRSFRLQPVRSACAICVGWCLPSRSFTWTSIKGDFHVSSNGVLKHEPR